MSGSPTGATGSRAVVSIVVLAMVMTPLSARAADDWHAETRGERLALAAFVAPYLGPYTIASVLVGVEARTTDSGLPPSEPATLTLSIADAASARQLVERAVSVPLGSAGLAPPAPFLSEVALAPGRYELHLREIAPSAATTLSLLFEVPSGARPPEVPFSMSPLTLTSSAVGTPATGDASEERRLFPLLLRPPSPRRRFAQDERVEVFVEIYDWDSEPGLEQQFTIRTNIRDDAGVTRHAVEEMGISEPLDSGRFGYAHSALIPIATLAPGRYVVDVVVESLFTAASVGRSMTFTVTDPAPRASR